MAGLKELNDVSSAILYTDTLAMDSVDLRNGALRNIEAAAVLSDAQLKGKMGTDSRAGGSAPQGTDDVVDRGGIGAQGMDCNEATETNHDNDESLVTDPGTLASHDTPGTSQVVFSEDAHEVVKTKEPAETDLETEIGYDDEGLMTDPGTPDTPGTPQEQFLQDGQELYGTEDYFEEKMGSEDDVLDKDSGSPLDEFPEDSDASDQSKDMNVDGSENDLEVLGDGEGGEKPLSSGPRLDDSTEDFDAPDETKDMNVDEPENDLEVLGDGEGEKSLDGEKFLAPFPITRVKRIIKLDKDVRLVTGDAIALIAQATALFVQNLSSASFTVMLRTKRKTIRGPDVVLAAKSTRQYRECLGNDLATLLEESNGDTTHGENGPVEKDRGTSEEHVRARPQSQKSAKRHQLAAPPGSRPITNFFKA